MIKEQNQKTNKLTSTLLKDLQMTIKQTQKEKK